jgi:hypothetical protein
MVSAVKKRCREDVVAELEIAKRRYQELLAQKKGDGFDKELLGQVTQARAGIDYLRKELEQHR